MHNPVKLHKPVKRLMTALPFGKGFLVSRLGLVITGGDAVLGSHVTVEFGIEFIQSASKLLFVLVGDPTAMGGLLGAKLPKRLFDDQQVFLKLPIGIHCFSKWQRCLLLLPGRLLTKRFTSLLRSGIPDQGCRCGC